MKKLLSVLVALVLLLTSSACAAELDFSSMSVSDLQEVINAARNELLKQTAISDGKLFVVDEPNDLQIYITGNGETNWMGTFELEAVVINNSKQDVSIAFENVVINGWETNAFGNQIQNVSAGRKKKDSIPLAFEEAEISSLSQVEEIEMSFYTFDPSTYNTLKHYGPYIFYFDGTNWSK